LALDEAPRGHPRPEARVRGSGEICLFQGVDPRLEVGSVGDLGFTVLPVLLKEFLAWAGGFSHPQPELHHRLKGEEVVVFHGPHSCCKRFSKSPKSCQHPVILRRNVFGALQPRHCGQPVMATGG
jgi:hypothetical protein